MHSHAPPAPDLFQGGWTTTQAAWHLAAAQRTHGLQKPTASSCITACGKHTDLKQRDCTTCCDAHMCRAKAMSQLVKSILQAMMQCKHTQLSHGLLAWSRALPKCTPKSTQRQTCLILTISAGVAMRLLGTDLNDLPLDCKGLGWCRIHRWSSRIECNTWSDLQMPQVLQRLGPDHVKA